MNMAFKLFVFDGDVTKLKAVYDIKFIGNPESVCVDHKHGCVWVGDDNDSQPLLIRLEMPGINEIAPVE